MRIDEYISKHFNISRNKAKELIKENKIKVDGNIINKPSFKVENHDVEILEKVYVSRAAFKLKNYLEKYNIDFHSKIVLDIGASSGGFSEVSLEKGAKKVVAVDVGSNQLHQKLREDRRVESFENCDIRDFKYNQKFDIVVSDVSFISLIKIIDVIDKFAKKDIILLFKPQFEVGKEAKRNKKGVVVDEEAIKKARENFEKEAKKLNWKLLRSEKSSIKGKEGNIEYIYHFIKEDND